MHVAGDASTRRERERDDAEITGRGSALRSTAATTSASSAALRITRTTNTTASTSTGMDASRRARVRDFAAITRRHEGNDDDDLVNIDRRGKQPLDSLSSVSPISSVHDLSMRSLSAHNSSDNQSVHELEHGRRALRGDHSIDTAFSQQRRRAPAKASAAAPRGSSSFDESPAELQQIKDSVQRLRAQRTHVQQLRQHNERLELLLAERGQENEKLRRELAALQGTEKENVGLLQSFKLLEERIRGLEATCDERKDELRSATERMRDVERDRDELQLQVDELSVVRDRQRAQLESRNAASDIRIEQLVKKQEKELDKFRRSEAEWQRRVDTLQADQARVEAQCQDELRLLRDENASLVREARELEQQVQQLLATTVRQTTVIEDCDRALSEAKARHESTKASYADQLQLNAQLKAQLQQLETRLATTAQSGEADKRHLEQRAFELESKVEKLKDKCDLYRVALQEKENQLEKMQSELLVRDRSRFHVEEVVKELRQREKALMSDVSELKVALADVTDEKTILADQNQSLQAQLEKERKDRSRWASARLKLLAEFCDEESKLSSTLNPYATLELLGDDGDELDELDDDVLDGDDARARVHDIADRQASKGHARPIVFG